MLSITLMALHRQERPLLAYHAQMSNFGNSSKENQIYSNFGPENAKMWQVLSRNCQIMALLR